MGKATFGPELFNQLLERQILMRECVERGRTCLIKMLEKSIVASKLRSQQNRVCEKADKRLQL